jgi:hypothetical protein
LFTIASHQKAQRNILKKIIENESIYEFHKVLIFFQYLSKYKEKYAESDPDLTEYLIKILEYIASVLMLLINIQNMMTAIKKLL